MRTHSLVTTSLVQIIPLRRRTIEVDEALAKISQEEYASKFNPENNLALHISVTYRKEGIYLRRWGGVAIQHRELNGAALPHQPHRQLLLGSRLKRSLKLLG